MSGIGRIHRKSYDISGHAHYLTFSCFGRRPFFSGERACLWFGEFLDRARAVHPFELWAYVIMPEHVHLLILPHDGVRVAGILAAMKQPLTRRVLGWVEKNAPGFLSRMLDQQPNGRRCHRFWQRGGGYDRNLWSVAEVHEKLQYIHANPVRRGLVNDPRDWQWSSYRAWEEGVDEPLRVDRETLPPLES